ncbi:sugar ABC transporter permease [Bifidobacterium sp. B4001]|uniref:carbohydrate ABC transporter permease n=1 Tax=unclassified Bifidobacterium TaxID=2608897 RepID=UPI00226B1B6D|nr:MULTISPECIES: sugar ABC transporter permease [unclassified Bifidobacterium]MCX8673116.1 sugar ABC transporter permease [Bifidobacterium sp. B4079]MCX8681549.1 sugar ABC transporter permease [Bifidobacterium sp. B4001]
MSAVSVSAGPGSRAESRKERLQHIGMLWCLPYVIVFLGGTIIPMVYAFYLGLFKQQMIGGEQFTGFANYIRALKDPLLWDGFKRVAVFAIIEVPLMTFLALLAALMLDSQRIRHVAIPRILLFLPYAVPNVIAALMWSYIYGTDYGLIGQFFRLFNAHAPNMMSKELMIFAMINISIWVSMGYNTLIYYSSLKALPEELYESARVDGASEFRIAWSVKIPQIRSSVVMTLLFNIIYALQLFNTPSMMQTIAPEVVTSYYTPNLYTYSLAFSGNDLNYAAAVSLVVGLFTMIIITVVKTLGNRWEGR